ncbi:hypothetical protein [Methylobacterium oryzisoli]|uniref:hypothetical protein n=1 Tax=Methylobacterium oryzisoli TaxID=3385502 RepID=UPI003891FECC
MRATSASAATALAAIGLILAASGTAPAAEPRRPVAPPPNAPAAAPGGTTCDLFLHCVWNPLYRPPCGWRWRPTPEGPRRVRVCF